MGESAVILSNSKSFNWFVMAMRSLEEPVIDLGQLLHQACDEAAIHLAINYTQMPVPSLDEKEATWLQNLRPA